MDKEDVTIEIASIRNALYKTNLLVAMTKMVELQKMLKAWSLDGRVTPLLKELTSLIHHKNPDTSVLDAKLKELDAMVL